MTLAIFPAAVHLVVHGDRWSCLVECLAVIRWMRQYTDDDACTQRLYATASLWWGHPWCIGFYRCDNATAMMQTIHGRTLAMG